MKKSNKEKSNRAQADYFELLVCQHICHLYKVTFSYSKDLAKLSNKVLERADGAIRLKLQNDNFIKIQPEIKKILDEAIKKMKSSKFERLPVVENNKLVGIITIKDILNFHPEIYPELEEFAKIREESNKLKLVKKAKEKELSREGICEECGHQEILYKVNGMLICESCRD